MAEHSPVEIMRHASTLSILWGVLLIVFGVFAVGSPFIAAVAVKRSVDRSLPQKLRQELLESTPPFPI